MYSKQSETIIEQTIITQLNQRIFFIPLI